MFLNKKNSNCNKDETRKNKSDYILSSEVLERCKQSGYAGLSDLDIEILFSDADWKRGVGTANQYETFKRAIEGLNHNYSNIIFPKNDNNGFTLKPDNSRVMLNNCIFYGALILDLSLKKEEKTFVDIEECDFHHVIIFEKGIFKLRATKSTFENKILVKDSVKFSEFELRHCKLEELYGDNINEIIFDDICLNKITTSSLDTLILRNVEIKDYLSIENTKNTKNSILIEKCVIKNIFSHSNGMANDISISDSKILEDVSFSAISVSLYESSLKKVSVSDCKYCGVSGSNIKDLYISSNDRVLISNSSITKALRVSCEYLDVNDSCNIKSLTIFTDGLKIVSSRIGCLDIKIAKSLIISDLTIDEIITLEHLQTHSINIDSSVINGYANFSYLEVSDLFCVTSTNFYGKMDVRFSDILKIILYKCKFYKINFDCIFNERAKFSYLEGLDQRKQLKKLDRSIFESEESWEFFNKTKHYETHEPK